MWNRTMRPLWLRIGASIIIDAGARLGLIIDDKEYEYECMF